MWCLGDFSERVGRKKIILVADWPRCRPVVPRGASGPLLASI
jgi:hypothetical protein